MKRFHHAIALCLFLVGASPVGFASAAMTLIPTDENGPSYIMPSIWRDPGGAPGEFQVSYIEAYNYFHLGAGDIYAGKAFIDANSAEWAGSGAAPAEPLNEDDVMVGFNPHSGDDRIWTNYLKPNRRGDFIAWSQLQQGGIGYYDFQQQQRNSITVDTTYGRLINPRVTSDGVLSYWHRVKGENNWSWSLQIKDLLDSQDAIEVEGTSQENYFWPRCADLVNDGSRVRVVYPKVFGDPRGHGDSQLYMATVDLDNQTVQTSELLDVGHVHGGLTSITMSGDWLVWYASDPAMEHGHLHVARWEEELESYAEIGELFDPALNQEPSLFGQYLVYVSEDKKRVRMADLDQFMRLGSDRYEPMTLAEAETGGLIEWPAAWVDEVTGEYVTLYQESASPASLKVAAGVIGSIPEPSAVLMLVIAAGMSLRWRSR